MSDNKKTKSRNPSTRHLLGLLSLLFSVIALVIASKPLLLHTNDNMQNKLSAISSHSMQLQNQIQLLQQQFTELENKSQQPAISEKDRSIIFTLDSIKQQLLDLNLTPRQAQNNDSQPKPSSSIGATGNSVPALFTTKERGPSISTCLVTLSLPASVLILAAIATTFPG